MSRPAKSNRFLKSLQRFLVFLLTASPFRTLLGVVTGLSSYFTMQSIAPLLQIDILSRFVDAVPLYAFIALFIFAFNISEVFRQQKLDAEIEKALYLIKKARNQGLISETQARERYRQIVKETLEKIVVEGESDNLIEDIGIFQSSDIRGREDGNVQ